MGRRLCKVKEIFIYYGKQLIKLNKSPSEIITSLKLFVTFKCSFKKLSVSNLFSQTCHNRGAKTIMVKSKTSDCLTVQFYMSFVSSDSIYSGFSCLWIELPIESLGYLKGHNTMAKINITLYNDCKELPLFSLKYLHFLSSQRL